MYRCVEPSDCLRKLTIFVASIDYGTIDLESTRGNFDREIGRSGWWSARMHRGECEGCGSVKDPNEQGW